MGRKANKRKNDDEKMSWVIKEPWADWAEEEQLNYFRLEQETIHGKIMKITPKTSLYDVDHRFAGSWVIVHMKDRRTLHLYIVDTDDEFQRHDEDGEPELNAIVYNMTGSNSYGDGIAFDDIDSIELDHKH